MATPKKQSFHEWLRDKFASTYYGLDDEMPDCEADWFADLDPVDVIEWAEEWAEEQKESG